MRNRQTGVSLGGLLVGLFLLIIVALLGMKLFPPYAEYFTAKGAIKSIAQDNATASVAQVRKAFEARAAVDDIRSIQSSDLEISKDGGQVVIGFAYRKEVPLFSNVGVYIDFAASSQEQ